MLSANCPMRFEIHSRCVMTSSLTRSLPSYPFSSNATFALLSLRTSLALLRGAFAMMRIQRSAFISGKNVSLKPSGRTTEESGLSSF